MDFSCEQDCRTQACIRAPDDLHCIRSIRQNKDCGTRVPEPSGRHNLITLPLIRHRHCGLKLSFMPQIGPQYSGGTNLHECGRKSYRSQCPQHTLLANALVLMIPPPSCCLLHPPSRKTTTFCLDSPARKDPYTCHAPLLHHFSGPP